MLEVESYLINTLLSYPEEIPDAALALKPEDFAQGREGVIFAELLAMTGRGVAVDIVTLADSLKASGSLERAGGVDHLRDITAHFSTGPGLIPEHSRIIREASQRRQMRYGLQAALEALADPMRPVAEVAGMAEAVAMVGVGGGESTEKMAWEYIPEIIDMLDRQRKGEISGVTTGLYDLDQHLSGLQRSDLIVLGGRPRMGKTALATDIAANIAIDQRKSVCFFSLEMAGRDIVMRHLLARARINGQAIRRGKLPREDYPRLAIAIPAFNERKWLVDGGTMLSPLQMLSKCRRHRMKHGLDLIVVDNIQKMRGDGKYGGNKRLEIADITNALKNMAKDLDVPILAISHLSRGPDNRADPVPVLSDLQESGNIEQDADIVLFVYREEEYKDVPADKIGETKLIIAKYRNGQAGVLNLHFNKELSSFENWGGARREAPASYKEKQVESSHGDFYGHQTNF